MFKFNESFYFTIRQIHTAQCEVHQTGKQLHPPLFMTVGLLARVKYDIKGNSQQMFFL